MILSKHTYETHSKIIGEIPGKNTQAIECEQMQEKTGIGTKKICTSLLVTGMRYSELERFRENQNWLEGQFIYLPRGSMLKVKAKQKEFIL